jgi:outer membrane protein assembly factor BamB
VKATATGTTQKVAYRDLVPGAPTTCSATFSTRTLPWPPSPTAQPRTVPCLSQRPGVNITPAIAPDGTIYTVSVAHSPFASRYAYVLAVNPDLTPKWAASMRGRLNDGCNNDTGTFPGSVLPANGTPGGCRLGANPGVDPSTNQPPAGRVIDASSSAPVVAPDGSVLYGSYTRYNYARGHLFHFSSTGQFLNAYDFGWDSTPATAPHGGTYSVVIKDNHYDAGSYCNSATYCPVAPQGPYYITQLTPNLAPEWQFRNTNTQSCSRNPNGTLTCTTTHPNGFEWCINAPAVDVNGIVYANSEDGNLYSINPNGTEKQRIFLNLAIGAAYTPLSISGSGLIYTENDGHLFVVGDGGRGIDHGGGHDGGPRNGTRRVDTVEHQDRP